MYELRYRQHSCNDEGFIENAWYPMNLGQFLEVVCTEHHELLYAPVTDRVHLQFRDMETTPAANRPSRLSSKILQL